MLEMSIFYGHTHLPIPRRRGPSTPTFSRFLSVHAYTL